MVLAPMLMTPVDGAPSNMHCDKRAAMLCRQATNMLACGDMASAFRTYLAATRIDANAVEAWIQMGDALSVSGKSELALVCHRKALELDKSALQYLRYANALTTLLRFKEAERNYYFAVSLDTTLSKAWYGLAYIRMMQGESSEARTFINQALRLEPDVIDMRYTSAVLSLSIGDWQHGFSDDYEVRDAIQSRGNPDRQKSDLPLWQGQDLTDKTLYLYSEQGFGDIILFLRFVRRLPPCNLAFMVPREMRRLIEHNFSDMPIVFHNAGTPAPPADYCLPLGSIPQRIMSSDFSVESETYLAAPAAHLLHAMNTQKTVGVVWAGDPKHSNDRWRSAYPLDFIAALDRPGVELYSLQIGDIEVDTALLGEMGLMRHITAHVTDFMDTACIIAALDCVVSVDTAVANLCGAMGKQCHVLVPYGGADWRWMHHCKHSPWYPSVTIHRQQSGQSWRSVLEDITL